MDPISPVIAPEFQDREVVFAKDQPQYRPLPVHRTSDGALLSRWKLTDQEREAVAAGADFFLYNWTFNHALQPVRMEIVECDRDLIAAAQFMELLS